MNRTFNPHDAYRMTIHDIFGHFYNIFLIEELEPKEVSPFKWKLCPCWFPQCSETPLKPVNLPAPIPDLRAAVYPPQFYPLHSRHAVPFQVRLWKDPSRWERLPNGTTPREHHCPPATLLPTRAWLMCPRIVYQEDHWDHWVACCFKGQALTEWLHCSSHSAPGLLTARGQSQTRQTHLQTPWRAQWCQARTRH